ncbi:MAG TPA: sigma-70 family RNA polymerase sigma factor [Actinomycetes bacterium]|jgi:RNA polymerase sigma-70 factor (ECF subfamily)|nr:sigma-70 family RNA polymerase sigma factor [Actinomycetes bacterium]
MDDLDALVDAARAGGGWAFGRLWESLAPRVAAYLRAGGVRDADDATSEVFLAAFRGIGRFEGDGAAFRAWLFTIAHHKGVDAHRRSSRQEVPLAAVVDELAGRAAPSAEDVAMARADTAEALSRLAVLTQDQRSVLLLRIVAELSLAETAEVLGKPVGAVKALQHRALARLRHVQPLAVSPGTRRTITRST